MAITLKSRKPGVKLTLADFNQFPIWEYATDEESEEGQDETWVRPVGRKHIPVGEYSQLVAASFTAPGGLSFQGFMVVTTAGDPFEISPGAIIGRRLYAVLPTISRGEAEAKKYPWSLRERKELERLLRLDGHALFPLQYQLRVLIRGEKEKRSGLVP